MEIADVNGGSPLVSELSHIQGLVKQLQDLLEAPSSPASLCKQLASEILSLTDKSIGIINTSHLPMAGAGLGSPPSGTPSPLSDASDAPFKSGKKRKAMPRWKRHVRVSSVGGVEGGHAEDGYSWRKYGQKDILGSKHPRGYYRCTHRNSQGCPATKQVQRTDADPMVFDVIYHGEHTCVHNNAGPVPCQADKRPHVQALEAFPLPSSTAGVAAEGRAVSLPPCQATGHGEWPSEAASLQEVVSTLAAMTGAPMSGLDAEFVPDYFEFSSCFDLDDSSLFS